VTKLWSGPLDKRVYIMSSEAVGLAYRMQMQQLQFSICEIEAIIDYFARVFPAQKSP